MKFRLEILRLVLKFRLGKCQVVKSKKFIRKVRYSPVFWIRAGLKN